MESLFHSSRTLVSRTLRTQRRPLTICRQCLRKLGTDSKVFAEGDVVLLRHKNDSYSEGFLTKPLVSFKTSVTRHGAIPHASLIGARVRDTVTTSKGSEYRVYEPTLAEYVRLTPRLVTPIYPGDANLIVSLLDIHVSPPTGPPTLDAPSLEILEAGTGHGALTLHLARAIQAANAPLPASTAHIQSSAADNTPSSDGEEADPVYQGESIADLHTCAMESWKRCRTAVLHTLDVNPKTSAHARKVVAGFRHGLYAPHVDFHIGDVSEWIEAQFAARASKGKSRDEGKIGTDEGEGEGKGQEEQQPFLSHVLLDLPGAEAHLENVAKALRVDGLLTVFNPSVTQVAECVEVMKKRKLPFMLEQVVELGSTASNRLWDVRAVRPRASVKKLEEVEEMGEEGEVSELEVQEGVAARDEELAQQMEKQDEWKLVCRPKVGERIVGGGFLGVWRRMRH